MSVTLEEKKEVAALDEIADKAAAKRVRLDFLDGVRGLAALYVVIHHAYLEVAYWQAMPGQHGGAHQEPLPEWVLTLFHPLIFGHVAVAIFIVLSGFCLMLPVARRESLDMPGGFWPYIKRRARRILPPYYAALALSLLIIALIPGMHTKYGVRWDGSLPAFGKLTLLSHALLIQDLHPNWAYAIDYPMWSVAVEWQIYFLFPLILLPILRKAGPIAAIVAGFVVGLTPFYLTNHHHMPLHLDISSPWMVGLFALGMASATIVFSPKYALDPRYRWLGSGWMAGIFFLWAVTANFWETRGWQGDAIVGIWTAAVLAFCAMHLVHAPDKKTPLLVKIFEAKPVVSLGIFSYSLYLIHAPILALLHLCLRPLHLAPVLVVCILLFVGVPLALGLAYLFHRVFERPFMNLPAAHVKTT